MKKFLPAFVLGLLFVPFIFNSCQSGFQSQNGLASFSPTSCKVGLEKGQTKVLTHSYLETPNAFVDSKLQLYSNSGSSHGMHKAGSEMIVPKGSSLSAIYNNLCLKEESEASKAAKLWDLISPDGLMEPLPDLITQAYTIRLERDFEVSELEELTGADSCLVGVSWNESYAAQSVVFSDLESYKQGHLPNIRAAEAYDKAYGSDLSQADAVTDLVKVAVVDSGVDWKHPDLKDNLWRHSLGWGIDATTIHSGLVNYNPVDISSNGHGTHIAGLVGAVSNNSLGIIGTFPFNAQIMAIKIFKLNAAQELETNSTHVFNGLQFAILNGAEVINLSLMASGTSYDAVFETAIEDALARKITVVGAMGNGAPGKLVNSTTDRVVPAVYATYSGVMAVGSYDSATDQKSDFSHYSPIYAEISAPGAEQGLSQGIYSTLPTALGTYGRLAGTSQSTGIVSGAAALAIAMIKKSYASAPTPTEVERLIVESAKKNNALANYFKDGNQLDMASLVDKIHAEYPLTKTGEVTEPPPGCP